MSEVNVVTAKAPKITVTGIDKAVSEALRSSGLDKGTLSAAVKFARDLGGSGVKVTRVLTKGTPRPDIVELEAHLAASQLGELINILKNPRAKGVIVFPKGIPFPDIFVTQIELR